jgi:hypothetical protein
MSSTLATYQTPSPTVGIAMDQGDEAARRLRVEPGKLRTEQGISAPSAGTKTVHGAGRETSRSASSRRRPIPVTSGTGSAPTAGAVRGGLEPVAVADYARDGARRDPEPGALGVVTTSARRPA